MKRTVSGIMFTLVLTGMLILKFDVKQVESSARSRARRLFLELNRSSVVESSTSFIAYHGLAFL